MSAHPDREHIVDVYPRDMGRLRAWLEHPNGALILGPRLTLEAVESGGIWVRTDPCRYIPPEPQ